jgi:hypothetical protein
MSIDVWISKETQRVRPVARFKTSPVITAEEYREKPQSRGRYFNKQLWWSLDCSLFSPFTPPKNENWLQSACWVWGRNLGPPYHTFTFCAWRTRHRYVAARNRLGAAPLCLPPPPQIERCSLSRPQALETHHLDYKLMARVFVVLLQHPLNVFLLSLYPPSGTTWLKMMGIWR